MTDDGAESSVEGERHGDGPQTSPGSVALVAAAGGAGATRLTVEIGGRLAAEGHDVAAFDAALDTQGMSDCVEGRVDPDATDLLTGEVAPATAMVEVPLSGAAGRLHLCPARAPFGDLARAKAPETARRLGTAIDEATDAFDYVLVDVPPVATNPAVAAVTAVDRVAVVAPPGRRGTDAVQRTRGRLSDVGAEADLVVANRGDPGNLDAAVAVPEGPTTLADAPTVDTDGGEFETAIGRLAETLFDLDLTTEAESTGLLGRI